MKIHCIKHVDFEGPGAIADWARDKGHELVFIKAYLDQEFPDPEACSFVVVMGGPMNVYEEEQYPWLKAERKFLAAAVAAGARVIGICLGAQLLSVVLGGKVTRNAHKEIGFFPVQMTDGAAGCALFKPMPRVLPALHWHGDTFSIPEGAVRVAQSLRCANQAFVYQDRVVALQFHLEATAATLAELIRNCADEIATPSASVQTAEDMLARSGELADMQTALFGLLDRLEAAGS
ncbi:MAG: type 1 glutamine amidotransferase [Desulfovibrionaceae bacterium]